MPFVNVQKKFMENDLKSRSEPENKSKQLIEQKSAYEIPCAVSCPVVCEFEIAYADPSIQFILPVRITFGSQAETITVLQVLQSSSISDYFPSMGCHSLMELAPRLSVFGERANFDTILKPGARISILRPLLRDPKLARILKGKKDRLTKIQEREKLNIQKKSKYGSQKSHLQKSSPQSGKFD